jgi:predicted ferric reductase
MKDFWARVVHLIEFVYIIFGLTVFISLSLPLFRSSLLGTELLSYLSGLAALLFSWVGFYLLTVRPFLTKPQLRFSVGPAQKSKPTDSEKQGGGQNELVSKVTNYKSRYNASKELYWATC